MAKNKNKGFTLIEVIIAIAILTLLLTPIMKQFAQTLETSRKAKELQYANEGAAYLLEYSQKNDLSKLATGTDATDNADELKLAAAPVSYKVIPGSSSAGVNCAIYKTDGTPVTGLDGNVLYTATKYQLNDVKLGARNTVYHRSVVTDDLAIRLVDMINASGKGYKIAYNMTKDDLDNFPEGFELTNEGSIVKYNDGLVVAAACYEADRADNPNDTNLGNMQNLDATKVAIINGTASSFDAQAESSFYLMAMELLKEKDYDSYAQALMHESQDSVLNTIEYMNSLHKLTKIYIDFVDNGNADKTDDYYIIKADVYYATTYSIQGNDGTTYSANGVLDYNVFSQKFYTDRCPDIYFEYQPHTVDYAYGNAVNKVTYAANDDIIIDNYVVNPDGDGDGAKDKVKIYLYKPTKDQSNTAYADTTNKDVYYTTAESGKKVKINIYRANDDVKYADIYTNLVVDTDQFGVTARNTISSVVSDSKVYTSTARKDYSMTYINELAGDKRTDDRLMTVTVKYTPESKSVSEIRLSGAKGGN